MCAAFGGLAAFLWYFSNGKKTLRKDQEQCRPLKTLFFVYLFSLSVFVLFSSSSYSDGISYGVFWFDDLASSVNFTQTIIQRLPKRPEGSVKNPEETKMVSSNLFHQPSPIMCGDLPWSLLLLSLIIRIKSHYGNRMAILLPGTDNFHSTFAVSPSGQVTPFTLLASYSRLCERTKHSRYIISS